MLKWVEGRGGFIQSSEDKQLRFWDERTFKPVITYPIDDYIHVSEGQRRYGVLLIWGYPCY